MTTTTTRLKETLTELKKGAADPILAKLLEILLDLAISFQEAVESNKREIEKIRVVLLGNGDPTHSLVNEVAEIKEDQCTTAGEVNKVGKEVSKLKGLVIGDLENGVEGEAMLPMLKRMDGKLVDLLDKQKWLERLLIGFVITAILGAVFAVIFI